MIHYEIETWANRKWQKVKDDDGDLVRHATPEGAFADKEILEHFGDKVQVIQVLEKRTVIESLSMVKTK